MISEAGLWPSVMEMQLAMKTASAGLLTVCFHLWSPARDTVLIPGAFSSILTPRTHNKTKSLQTTTFRYSHYPYDVMCWGTHQSLQ